MSSVPVICVARDRAGEREAQGIAVLLADTRCGSAPRRRRSCRRHRATRSHPDASRRCRSPICRRCSVWFEAPASVLDAARPTGRSDRRRGAAGGAAAIRADAGGFDSDGVNPVGDDLLVARRHHVRRDRDAARCPRRSRAAGRGDARLGVEQRAWRPPSPVMPSFWRSHRMRQRRRAVGQPVRLASPRWSRRRSSRPAVAMWSSHDSPPLPFGLVVALDPHLDRHQHADRFFLADLHRPGVAVMRRAVDPRGLHQILAAEQQARGLRTAQALAAAVADERRAVLRDGRWGWSGSPRRRRPAPGPASACAIGAIALVLSGLLSAFGPARM